MTGIVGIIGGRDRKLEELVRAAGMRAVVLTEDQLASPLQTQPATTDVVLLDIRGDRRALSIVAPLKRRYPTVGIAVVVASLDPQLIIDAMRAGVNEVVCEPLTQANLDGAIRRVIAQRATPADGRVFAVIGAKGGIGATTIAVNLSEALAQTEGGALLIDLQMGAGDANILLGVEPQFSVAEAIENTTRLDEAYLRGLVVHTKSGLDLLAASPRAIAGAVDATRARALMEVATRYYGVVVLDVPRGDVSLLDSLDIASAILVVVNHELPTVRSAQRVVAKLQQRYGERVGVLVNRSDLDADITIDDIRKAVKVPVRHVFPSDYRQALAAANKGRPLVHLGRNKLAESFRECAEKLIGKPVHVQPELVPTTRIFGWLTPRHLS